jgi:siroheme synthase-like protein
MTTVGRRGTWSIDHDGSKVALYPVFLNLAGKPVLVAGGGPVAVRKARGLLDAGAIVTIVSPELTADLPVHWKRRRVRVSDVAGMSLVFAATNDRRVNARIARAAQSKGILVNVADAPGECDFAVPARIRRNGFHLAISTDGENPRAAAALRRQLEELL